LTGPPDEIAGITVNLSKSGTYEVCAQFQWQPSFSAAGTLSNNFYISEYSLDGTSRIGVPLYQIGARQENTDAGSPFYQIFYHVCGHREFTAGKHAFALEFGEDRTGSISSSNIIADTLPGSSERHIIYTVKTWSENFPPAVAIPNVGEIIDVSRLTGSGFTNTAVDTYQEASFTITLTQGTWLVSLRGVMANLNAGGTICNVGISVDGTSTPLEGSLQTFNGVELTGFNSQVVRTVVSGTEVLDAVTRDTIGNDCVLRGDSFSGALTNPDGDTVWQAVRVQ
jgi:hypothetical protein